MKLLMQDATISGCQMLQAARLEEGMQDAADEVGYYLKWLRRMQQTAALSGDAKAGTELGCNAINSG